ncbi:hypothetical protein J2X65_004676 [Ancylobacter sp. 3268]|uniref:hypothetical protein n=1 Tax=Ancylobacter sp. 3268 TaxID=2817752 RepID=UPI00285A3266|nr:hypothetical protein [Ancylobacter sp. 3268]MDR6955297.1 hypothetical protein [Ancylobacter sp. 3268]
MRNWLVGLGSVIAAVALVVGNADKILSFAKTWVAPSLAPYFTDQAVMTVRIEPGVDLAADVFAADPANANRAVAVAQARKGEDARLTVPARMLYTLGWQGPGLKAGAAEKLLAVEGGSVYMLGRKSEADGLVELTLRRGASSDGGGEPPAPAAGEPSAGLLLSARAARAVADPGAAPPASGSLPEFDRALAIVGLFETGTTDCGRRVSVERAVRGFGRSLSVGCVGASIPGWLGEMIAALDDGTTRRLDTLLGEDAKPLRALANGFNDVGGDDLARAGRQLMALPEFRIAYQQRVLDAYRQAAEFARAFGLASERGRLLVFDRLVQAGPGSVRRALTQFAALDPAPPTGEPERIAAVGALFAGQRSGAPQPAVARRIDTIVTGRGTVRGIAFSLDELGVSATP